MKASWEETKLDDGTRTEPGAIRLLLRVFAVLAAVPWLVIVAFVVTGVATWSGVLYVLATGIAIAGLATLPPPGVRTRRRPRGVTRAAFVLIGFVALVRSCTASRGERLTIAEGRSGAPLVDRLVDEGDVALTGTRVLVASGLLHDDARELPAAMGAAYADLRAAEGDAPSPVVATYLGLQRRDSFDLVTIEPREAPTAAVVFLHGYAGNFNLPCWQVARAVEGLSVLTACPSTRWIGDWWTPEGEATLRRAVDLVHARGIDRIVLVGLSNGGYGAAVLAPKMAGTFAGIVLVSGAPANGPPPGVPALVIHGRYDTMASAPDARAYATKHGARYVALDAGHFAMLVRGREADREIRAFVAERTARVAGR